MLQQAEAPELELELEPGPGPEPVLAQHRPVRLPLVQPVWLPTQGLTVRLPAQSRQPSQRLRRYRPESPLIPMRERPVQRG